LVKAFFKAFTMAYSRVVDGAIWGAFKGVGTLKRESTCQYLLAFVSILSFCIYLIKCHIIDFKGNHQAPLPKMSRTAIPVTSAYYVVMLGLMSVLPPFGTDVGVPAIPSLMSDLNLTMTQATQILALFLVGLALGPVLFGLLSDHYGRKPVFLLGVAALLAAIVRDVFLDTMAVNRQSYVAMVNAVNPLVAPLIGAAIISSEPGVQSTRCRLQVASFCFWQCY